MLEFLLALLTTATVGALLLPLLRTRRSAVVERLDSDLAIYRDQLAEIEREQASGALGDSEAAAARSEIERRILAAADKDAKEPAPQPSARLHRFLPAALSLAIPLLALGVYLQIGRPGLPAAPFVAGRAAPATDDSAELAKFIEEAKKRAQDRPGDAEAQSALGEALTLEAQGVVSEPARQAFAKALTLKPDDPRAAYYLGLAEAQAGDSAAALRRWHELAGRSPPDAPWLPALREEMRRVGGEDATRGMPQPGAEQMQAMGRLSPEERQKAIRGMVDGLAGRLKQNPGDRDGWLRLANARKVLGENDKAAEAFATADALQPVEGRALIDWAETEVRQIQPGAAPSAAAVAVLQRLEKAQPDNALALFYLGAASFAAGDKAAANRRWKRLLALLPSDAPIRELLESKIKETE